MAYRIGIGYDIHRFAPNRKLILGGVHIPFSRGLLGHSDADVILHAVCDALLGAMGEDDIGKYFPDSNRRYKDISSSVILKKVASILRGKSYKVVNVDVMLLLERPKISFFKPEMKVNIAKILKITQDAVSVKATSHEGVGAIGKGQAAAAYAVVLIEKIK
ncbi:MAG: 2-C-methyl-D-erythritol 2,4-cyclodiphosphate synthase [Candidatus Omnitrophica bacterium CG1_02_44_16]|nr:MAG: 2-C-methyl-D-erythritol 2,4-cyclodiphosphate synthase [Candidatus Omnitrophica bacterium CG1_02_44_16]PIY83501.1 MAG: 2-C-methyl-D-erythritol 2,4-cyclodiphosphate synthase [Candidatus Omnitrophica bacterium CG_4_10_14_0_8_um_filter_44_12]PIZ84276.1 MAG: 2-C-methyl-D-erythritol 2,4-cyclodiphosphate synthase [Candidatus Omnitrophica bacterium CG_4_10_14_0_2_um_filter_44_9]